MKISKIRDVKTPVRGTPLSAGLDFFVPNDFPGTHYLIPGDAINIPSGIKVKVPHGYALVFMNKSGVAVKKGLQIGACVVDEDYQGEVIPVDYAGVDVVPEEDLFEEETERGEGGFGSTGTE